MKCVAKFRLPPFGVHLRHRISYIAEQHQWCTCSSSRATQYSAERPAVHRSGNNYWGRWYISLLLFDITIVNASELIIYCTKITISPGTETRLTDSLSLIDAVTPDIVAARQNAHNAQKQAIKAEPGSGGEQNGVDVCLVFIYFKKKYLDYISKIKVSARKQ